MNRKTAATTLKTVATLTTVLLPDAGVFVAVMVNLFLLVCGGGVTGGVIESCSRLGYATPNTSRQRHRMKSAEMKGQVWHQQLNCRKFYRTGESVGRERVSAR
jgi:hypothetical protein